MKLDPAITGAELYRVVGYQCPSLTLDDFEDVLILPPAETQMYDMCGFEAAPMRASG